MSLLPKVAWISILAAAALSSAPPQAAAQLAQIQRVGLRKSAGETQIEIQTSRRVIPLTQVLTDPDRLVIDFSDAVPSPQIHTINVNNGPVKQVRVGRVTDNPPITRVVIDLNSAQPFQLFPSGKSVIVKIGDGNASTPPATAVAKETPAEPAAHVSPSAPVVAREAPEEKPAAPPPVPQLAPARAASPVPAVAPVPVVARTVPPGAMRPAVMTSAPAPAPASSISRAPDSPSGPAQVRHVAVLKTSGATEIEIEISQRVTPEVQAVTGPDRLVVDFPQALPGPQLRAMAVNQGEVKGVRVGLLSAKPPVTRVVLDLKSPQTYQIFPSARSVIVKLPDPSRAGTVPATPQPEQAASADPAPESPALPPTKKVDITEQNGMLSLSSKKASLAEVLEELRKQTGAEIVVPPGAEGEEVAISLGPAAPRDVISQLLNGSRYNFIIVGADNDANRIQKLILTRKAGGGPVPETASSMPDATAVGQVETAQQRSGGPAAVVAPTVEEPPQPQGDSNPPPDTTPQPGDPQAAPN
jgi:hypothetical protein